MLEQPASTQDNIIKPVKPTRKKQTKIEASVGPLTDLSASPAERLNQLHKLIVECQHCPLYKTRTQAVPGEGTSTAKVLFIGEGPGKVEDKKGVVFSGDSGRVLDKILSHNNLTRGVDTYIANTVCCIPWKNNDPEGKEIRSPSKAEMRACKPYLDELLDILKPDAIVPLGAKALAYFSPKEKISVTHGKVIGTFKPPLIPMYHPAAAMHQPELKPIVQKDYAKLGKLLKHIRQEDTFRHPYRIVDTPLKLKNLILACQSAKVFAFDFETTSVEARSAAVVGMSVCYDGMTGHYIPTQKLPAKYFLIQFRKLFADPSILKIAHNIIFEMHILARYYHSYDVIQNYYDTMLGAYLFGEYSAGLKDLAMLKLDYAMTHIEDLIGYDKKKQITMDLVDYRKVADYAASDATLTYRLWSEVYNK